MIRVAHILDDTQLGGVTQHLELFNHSRLKSVAISRVLTVDSAKAAPVVVCDVIILHLTISWRKMPFLLSLRLRNPEATIILEEHSYTEGFEANCVSAVGRFRALLRCAYRLVDEVVAVSCGQATWMRNAGLVDLSRLTVIPMSRPTGPFSAVAPPEPRGRIRIGVLGRFAEQKGIEDAILAARDLDNVQLVIGGFGPLEIRLREAAKGASNIEFIGKVTDPPAFMKTIDALLMPSLYEAFGLTGLEARAAGRPLIAYAVDGLKDQLAAGGGVAVTTPNPAALRECLKALTAAQLEKLSPEARSGAVGSFDKQVEMWASLLRSCAGA